MNIESQRMKFESWIKTQRIVIREVSTDGGNTWSRTTVEPSELAMAAWMESARQNTQELTQRIGELCQQVNERDALIVTLKRDLNIYREHYRRNEKRCTECGGSLDDDGDGTRCHLCCEYPSSLEQKRNDAMERGDELRDRKKDEQCQQ